VPPGGMWFARGCRGSRSDPRRDARARSIRWFGVVPKCDLAIRHHVVLPFFRPSLTHADGMPPALAGSRCGPFDADYQGRCWQRRCMPAREMQL
jgi:hypothetical protein